MTTEKTIFYNDSKRKYDINIPVTEQADLFAKILSHDPANIIKTKEAKNKDTGYMGTGSYFSFRIQSYYMEYDGRYSVRFTIFINNTKEKIVYEIELTIYKSGSNYAWEIRGYSQDKLQFLEELLGKYILSLNNPVLFI